MERRPRVRAAEDTLHERPTTSLSAPARKWDPVRPFSTTAGGRGPPTNECADVVVKRGDGFRGTAQRTPPTGRCRGPPIFAVRFSGWPPHPIAGIDRSRGVIAYRQGFLRVKAHKPRITAACDRETLATVMAVLVEARPALRRATRPRSRNSSRRLGGVATSDVHNIRIFLAVLGNLRRLVPVLLCGE
jgi:hypothetical protein